MTDARRDRIVGIVLLAFAVAWTVTVRETIPTGFGGQVGPRAFPQLLGILLAALSAIMIVRSFGRNGGGGGEADGAPPSEAVSRHELFAVAIVVIAILAYGFFLPKVGFLVATPVLIALLLRVGLGVRSPIVIGLFAIGMTAGCWLVFNKLMGVYLPPGTWITLV